MLQGPEQLVWINVLFDAFSLQEFTDLLWHRLGDRISNYASAAAPFKVALSDVVDAYSRRDRESELIAGAVEARPRNAALLTIAGGQKAAAVPDRANVERLIRKTSSFLDIEKWLSQAGKLQVCVCRIEIAVEGGMQFGTGFLISPDRVMTNWHVVECIAAVEDNTAGYSGPRATANDLVCRFDYKVLDNGVTSHGAKFRLASDWRVALSPNTPANREPLPDELDCAVLQLSSAAGELPIGSKPNVPGDTRGWIPLPSPDVVPEFKEHSPLFIIQHPEGDPLKLALEFDSVQSVDANRTRVRYSTNTETGSSGSPCFDQNWSLVALHHAGDSKFKAEYNEGIPIDAIVKYLAKQGVT